MVLLRVFFIVVLLSSPVVAAEDLRVLPPSLDDAPTSNMMYAYLGRLAHEALDQRNADYEKIKTVEDAHAWKVRRRDIMIEQLGGFPERTPLNARVVGREQREDYRFEKIIFESQPGHYVTGVLFLPMTKPPHAAVLVPCGHTAEGKAGDTYQRASILLAKNGLAAFCYDPIGQGERSQILDDKGKPRFGSTLEHTLVGVGSILVGRGTATYRIWDGIRAIDYLQSRDDIDPKRIGCTGNSGGGTLSSYIMAVDERVVCAAPSCYLTTFDRLIDTIGPQDAEQNIAGQIALGLDHPDYVLMRAPKPTLMCVATRDYFDINGAWRNFRQAKRFYTRLGEPEQVDLVETDATHGFSTQLRVAAVRWMRRWLLDSDLDVAESDFEILKPEQLQCSPVGQVMLLEGARSVVDLNAEIESRLAEKRRELWKQDSKEAMLDRVRKIAGVRRLSEIPEPAIRDIGELAREGYSIRKLILIPERGVYLPALMFEPREAKRGVYLYLHGDGKHVDAEPGGPIESLVREGHRVCAMDLRGIGETRGGKAGRGWRPYFTPDWKDYFLAYMLNKPFVGMRAEDALVCARYFGRKGDATTPVHVVAIGETGPAALHAAALEPDLFATVRIERSIASWADVARTPVTRGQLNNAVHGALRVYDLPDLAATLPAGKCSIVNPSKPDEGPEK